MEEQLYSLLLHLEGWGFARVMMKHNKFIAMVRDHNQTLPIDVAASLCHRDMVEYLYEQTKYSLSDEDCIELLVTLIETDIYGK